MPKYAYRCESCLHKFEVRHSIKEKLTLCTECEENALIRIPSIVANIKITEKQQAGKVVDKFIKETRQEIEDYKKEVGNKVYKHK